MKHIILQSLPAQGVSHNPEIKKRVMLQKGDLPHLTTFAQATFAPGQITTLHSHTDMTEIFFVESGEGKITVEGAEYALMPGVCIVAEAGEQHQLANDGTAPLVITYFGINLSSKIRPRTQINTDEHRFLKQIQRIFTENRF